MFECNRYLGKISSGYKFIWIMIIGNIFLFFLDISSGKPHFNYLYVCAVDIILIILYFISFISVRKYRSNKIENAIYYGIIGTKVCNNSCYKEDEGKSYIIRKHQYKYSYIDNYSFSQEAYSKYYGVLDLFNKDTNEYVKSVTEEELWEMIKKVRCKHYVSNKVMYLSYFEITYPPQESINN